MIVILSGLSLLVTAIYLAVSRDNPEVGHLLAVPYVVTVLLFYLLHRYRHKDDERIRH